MSAESMEFLTIIIIIILTASVIVLITSFTILGHLFVLRDEEKRIIERLNSTIKKLRKSKHAGA